ncbi:hypothetical protein [Halorussus caseinilyticus]|uniref:Polymerase nucleotidyl transferase domain-containing protein n=1 Tax=Halorussus caseinilyticus TaxID=3034025 RepID=A0ABD5WMZ2_9EURY|nr:hypothetical protein [Halorussus sp. DT72]
MSDVARAVFRERAPLVDLDEFTEMIVSEVVTDELLSRTESIWLIGSFTNPGKEIDTNKFEWSDLDVYVAVSDWEFSQAATNMLIAEPSEPTPKGVPTEHGPEKWDDRLAGPKRWNCSVTEAWEQLPECARETIRKSAQKGFFRNHEEFENREVRYLDLFVGSRDQLMGQRERGRQSRADALPGFCIWESDE